MLVLHPVGVLRVSQRLVPLDLTISKVGNSKAADADRFTLRWPDPAWPRPATSLESFAPAQFQDLDDAAKLSSPAFQPGHGGIALSSSGERPAVRCHGQPGAALRGHHGRHRVATRSPAGSGRC